MSPQGVERLRGMPRVEAEVLHQEGGLLNQVDACLDSIVHRLETVGWAACKIGAHEELIRRARQEAQCVTSRMQPGGTVIKNQVITDERLKAQSGRGDKILWMQEQGLNGPNRNNGPTPTVALL